MWPRRSPRRPSEEISSPSVRDSQTLWASVWPRVLAVLVVVSVGLPAAVASYWHLQEVVARFNPGSALAYWLPLSVDGLLAAALVVVWSRRTRGERVGFGPWAAFSFGMIVTLLANAASVVPESEWSRTGSLLAAVAAWMVALFPPVAFAISLELIAIVLRPTRAAARAGARTGVVDRTGWTAPSTHTSPPAAPAAATAQATPCTDESRSSTLQTQPVQAVRAADEPAGQGDDDKDDTAPLPVVTPHPARRGGTTKIDTTAEGVDQVAGAVLELEPGATKQAKAEALFVAAWTRGEDPSLSEVDRLIGGNRTAAKAKRSLRDRGLLPPTEDLLPAQRVDAGPASTRLAPA